MDQIMKEQPIINIGCLGSVSDGKSTLVKQLTGNETQRHSSEKTRNITIKQGYGNMKIWDDGTKLTTTDSNITELKNESEQDYNLVNHLSFVDCPGHQELIKTMLSSIALMDGAVVVVAVDQPLTKKPQLIQHLAAAKLGKIANKIIVCMNKIDLVDRDTLMLRKEELDEMLQEYGITPYAIIPTCFNKKIGTKYLLRAIMELFNPAEYLDRTEQSPVFRISRSFDVNKPGLNWTEVTGGVIGGSLMTGALEVGTEIEIRPGQVSKTKDGRFICQPIRSAVHSIKTDTTNLDTIVPGGLIGIRTDLDPYYCKGDSLSGNIAGTPGTLPSVYAEVTLEIEKVCTFGANWTPVVNDMVGLQIGTRYCDAKVVNINKSTLKFELTKPACINDSEHIIICKELGDILKIVAESTMSPRLNSKKLI